MTDAVLGGADTTIPAGANAPLQGQPQQPAPWHHQFGENIRDNPALTKYKTIEDALAGHISQAAYLGDRENHVKLPGEGDVDGMNALMEKLGVPKVDTDYLLSDTEGAGENFKAKGDLAELYRKACFGAKVPPKQMQAAFNTMTKELTARAQQQEQEAQQVRDAQIAELNREWGAAADLKITQASQVAKHFGITQALNEANLGTNPGVIKMLAAVHKAVFAEDGGQTTGTGTQRLGGAQTPGEYSEQAKTMLQKAYATDNPAERARLMQRVFELNQLAFPS